ncbi:MAG: four helix bundle protein [Saprospiraceae bacterium]|uniref:Four helix bundle protein n=1 Tax=Candidatus Opimibacter skivensis TaxID=2982028 RepID=A0A9D7SXE0_9BACT|nr:four helix bundle protein [Candidatus Opimibacter skivensis]
MAKFRFEDLEIWQEAIRLAAIFFRIADEMEKKKLWRFADQLRGVGMSIPNNISESTGTDMIGEEKQLLRYAKRECYEGANIMVILKNESYISLELQIEMFDRLDVLSKRIQAYSNSLKR